MGECEGEECTNQGPGELPEPEPRILLAAHEADIRALAVFCSRRAGGSVPGEREAQQRSGLAVDGSDRLERAAETDSVDYIETEETRGNAVVLDLANCALVQSR